MIISADTYLTGHPLILPPDADLRAATMAQDDYLDYVL